MHEFIIHHLTNRNNICPRIEGDRSSSETVKKQERKGERGGGGGGEKKRRRLKWKKIGFKTSIGRDGISLPTGYFVSPDITTDLTAARVCFCGEEIGWPERRNTCRRGNVKYRVHGSKKISFFLFLFMKKGEKRWRRSTKAWNLTSFSPAFK